MDYGQYTSSVFLIQEESTETRYKIDAAQTRANPEGGRGENAPRLGVNKPLPKQLFTKLFDVAANEMRRDSVFCRNTRVLMYLLEQSTFGARVYATTATVAHDMNMDIRDARKILRTLEGNNYLMRMDDHILLNPHFFMAGSLEDDQIARAIWAREKNRRVTKSIRTRAK